MDKSSQSDSPSFPLECSMIPTFWRKLMDPQIKTILICGCGGGFDFVHSMNVYPDLIAMNKKVIIHSFSFGSPTEIRSEQVEWKQPLVKLVTGTTKCDNSYYLPEINMCAFLDTEFPKEAPHSVYASYARDWSMKQLNLFYAHLVKKHNVDAVLIIDGGSDSLMKGDERGLGDPVEDATSVGAVGMLTGLKAKILCSIGFGADRYNDVSDASSLRAVAELTKVGGFLGSISLEIQGRGFQTYSKCLKYIYEHQKFHSVLSGVTVAAAWGHYGFDIPSDTDSKTSKPTDPPGMVRFPVSLSRVGPGEAFLWPLMGMIWSFDIDAVVKRSWMIDWIKDCPNQIDAMSEIERRRRILAKDKKIFGVENLPTHEQMCAF